VTNVRVVGLLVALAVGIASWMLTCAAWRFDEIAAGVLPLEPRAFDRLTLVTLGTGSAYEKHLRRGPASAVSVGRDIAIVDAGRAVAEGLRAAQIPVSQPGVVLLTHLLPENTLGLDDLLVMGWIDGRSEPLRLLGPAGTVALARALEESAQPGAKAWAEALGQDGELPRFEAVELAGGESLELGDLRISAGALPGGPIPALAYRFEARGRSAVVSGTGWARDELTSFARGAQLLVHEAVQVPTPAEAAELELEVPPERLLREAALHTSLEQVGAMARRAGAETLVLVRLRPPPVYDFQVTTLVDDQFAGRIVVAADGDEIRP
jgi:ribonuclease BN (tRNA processing enzyme)